MGEIGRTEPGLGAEDVTWAIARLVLHETKTPLNAIHGFADLLLAGAGGALDAQALDYVDQVARAARALDRALGHLRDLAGLDGRSALESADVDLAAGLAAAGFRVAGVTPASAGAGFAVRGDPAAWRDLFAACRAYLEAAEEAGVAPSASLDQGAKGALAVQLVRPGAGRDDGTGLLALELAGRLARRVGAGLRVHHAGGLVLTWPDRAQTSGLPVGGRTAAPYHPFVPGT